MNLASPRQPSRNIYCPGSEAHHPHVSSTLPRKGFFSYRVITSSRTGRNLEFIDQNEYNTISDRISKPNFFFVSILEGDFAVLLLKILGILK